MLETHIAQLNKEIFSTIWESFLNDGDRSFLLTVNEKVSELFLKIANQKIVCLQNLLVNIASHCQQEQYGK